MKKGLILEGGAMRGMFTAGVIDVLMEEGVEIDGLVGVSAGAAFGCNYKSRQIGRVIRYNERFVRDGRYCGLGAFLRTGNVYTTDFCYGEVPLLHDVFDFDTFEASPMEFYVVATDVDTGEAVYHKYTGRDDGGFDWIRASASMPIVSQTVEIEGRRLLDGGIADPLPVKFFEGLGYDRCIAVLTQERGYRKRKSRVMPLVRLKYKNEPRLVLAMANMHSVYNSSLEYIEERERAGELLVIRPEERLPVKGVERNPKRLRRAYEIGRRTAERHLDKIKAYLSE